MNSLGFRTLILVAAVGAAFLFLATPLGDRFGGLNKKTVPENPPKSEEKNKTPLPVLRMKRDVLKAPTPPLADEPHLPAPKAVGSKAGALTNQEIEEAMSGRQSLFQRCWTQRLRDTPGLTGRTLLQFEITPRGKVQEVQVVESTLNDDLMLRCLVSVLERISFREFDGSGVTLTFPLSFE